MSLPLPMVECWSNWSCTGLVWVKKEGSFNLVRAFRDFILTGSCHSGPGLSQGSVLEAQKICLIYGSPEAKTEMGGGQGSDHAPPQLSKNSQKPFFSLCHTSERLLIVLKLPPCGTKPWPHGSLGERLRSKHLSHWWLSLSSSSSSLTLPLSLLSKPEGSSDLSR